MMRKFLTKKRLKKITDTLEQRQFTLEVAIENVHDSHNVSAIFRSCDAVGAPKVSLVYTKEKLPKISKVTSASAFKWVENDTYSSIKECYDSYRKRGFKVYASMLSEDAVSLYDLDLTEPCVLVLGNEHRGISEEAAELADEVYYIPMRGMVQSLNVSVAAAVSLYEAQRQRAVKGLYDSAVSEEQLDQLIDEWSKK
jgi:tRNA (guanosine-2'-O-)-methyltransferase